MNLIDKALGNIKKSNSCISFIALLNIKVKKIKIVHHQASGHLYDDVYVPKDVNKELAQE